MDLKVRVLEPDGTTPPPPEEPRRPLPPLRSLPTLPTVLVVGVLGLLVGYLFGAAREPAPPAPIAAAVLAGEDGPASASSDAAFEGEQADPQTSDVPPTTAPPTTVPPRSTEPPPPLAEQVPGFSGSLTYVDYSGFSPRLYQWHSRAGEAEQIDVPAASWNHMWNSAGRQLLYIAGERAPALYAGLPGRAEPLSLWVRSATWHATDASRLAWLAPTELTADAETYWTAPTSLFTLDLDGTAGARHVIDLPPDDRYDHTEWYLASMNDVGLAFQRSSWSENADEHGVYEWASAIVVLDHDGKVVYEEEGAGSLTSAADGSLLIVRNNEDGVERIPRLLQLDGTVVPTELSPGTWFAAVSPDGFYTAQITENSRLTISGPVGTVSFTQIVDTAAWSRDGRFLVATLAGGGRLLFYDRVTAQEYIVNANGSAYSLRVH